MPYSIDRYNGTTIAVVEDGTIDTTLDVKLIGKNYAGYGEAQNENLVHMLEHFSSPSQPPRPLSGQIWYDSGTKKLKFYDNSKWRTTGGSEIAATAPTGLTVGDFWWDTANNQLYAWDGAAFELIGPQAAANSGTTQMRSRSVRGTDTVSYAIIEAIVDEQTIYIISSSTFTLDPATNPITGFSAIKEGLTLINTGISGATTSAHRYWGTASNALKLGGLDASNFASSTAASFTSVARFADAGFTVGDSNDLAVYVVGSDGFIKNVVGSKISFQVTSGGVKTPLIIDQENIVPGTTNLSNIGSASFKYATVYATTFNGTATQSDTLSVGGTYRQAASTATANTIAARDASGDLYATIFRGTSTSARFADLAEKYLADADYEAGTVVVVGGEKEVTASSVGQRAIGVVSANPAYMMNSELEGGTYIALKGRVPVKVIGSVVKGQRLIAGLNGAAQPAFGNQVDAFAIALESNTDVSIKLVECVIL